MARATWNGTVIAEGESVIVENNHYFPRSAVRTELLHESSTRSVCPWKGNASYLSVVVNGSVNSDAAWTYPAPKDAAAEIKDHFAFWNGVEVAA